MNQKASVSKELNARHSKILEGLLKLEENRECADCQSRYDLSPWIHGYQSGLLLCNLWVMTSPTSTGNHNSHQIATEEVSRN